MKWNLRIGLRELAKRGVSKINKDVFVFGFFLFLSFVFWYLNSLGKVTESHIRYPVRYINTPEERVLVDNLPSRLDLYLKGPGYSILKLMLSGNRAPVILDISALNYRRVAGSNALSYYIPTSSLIQKLSSQLRSECEITTIKPDTLFFTFDRVITKLVPVKPDVDIQTERQYFVKGNIDVEPPAVKVTGPRHIIDTITSIKTKFRKFSGLRETIKRSLNLTTSGDYTISEKKVMLTIPVEQFTEADVNVTAKILNCPDSVNIRIFPDAVTVKGFVAISDYKKFREFPFDVAVDIRKADLKSGRLPVELLNTPAFASSVRLNPPDVDFLIEKKTR